MKRVNWNRNRKLRWNITIMVILVLLACSLMGILTIIFLRSLIEYTDDSYGYYKSYYVAKAWLELSLTEIENTDVWFSNEINSWNIVNNNFSCPWCNFTSRILWRSKLISNNFWQNSEDCQWWQELSIPWLGSMVLPMYYDNSTNFSELKWDSECLLWNNCEILFGELNKLELINSDMSKDLNIWIIFLSWGDISIEYLYMKKMLMKSSIFQQYNANFNDYYSDLWLLATLNSNINNQKLLPYIVLSNPNSEEVKFCIKNADVERPTTKYFVSSVWEYMWKTVGLQAIYEQPIPSFLINPYISSSNENSVYVNSTYEY